jgi:sporulation protein YlmC with PRC-barrel domain
MKAKEVVGREVVNTQSEEIGTIEAFVVDKKSKGLETVVSLDGILDITGEKVAVPIGWLQLQNDKIATLMTEEQLRSAAEYDPRAVMRIREQDSLLSNFVFTNTATQPGSTTP